MVLLDYDLEPLWVEKFLGNDELMKIFNKGMELRQAVFDKFEYAIMLEKQNPQLRGSLSRLAIEALLKNEMVVKRLLQKFGEDHYITTGLIYIYLDKIQAVRDKVLEITIRENLGGITK